MAGETIRVHGLKELSRDFAKLDRELRRDLQRELSTVAKIVSDDARAYLTDRYGSPVANKIRPRVRGVSAFAESRARSKGTRPHFGTLVMRALLVARARKEDEVVDGIDKLLGKLAGDF